MQNKKNCHLIEVQQSREILIEKARSYKIKMKVLFDKKDKENEFKVNDMVLRWDVRREVKGKHGKFDHLCFGPFIISEVLNNSTFLLNNLNSDKIFGAPVNGHFLKIFHSL